MTFGCKPENHPNGCGWAERVTYPAAGVEEWWCDGCERAGHTTFPAQQSRLRPESEGASCENRGTSESSPRLQNPSVSAPGGDRGPNRTAKEFG